jgi:hypothetical protein
MALLRQGSRERATWRRSAWTWLGSNPERVSGRLSADQFDASGGIGLQIMVFRQPCTKGAQRTDVPIDTTG